MKRVTDKRKVETHVPLPLKAPPTGDSRKNTSEEKQRVSEKEKVKTDVPLLLKAGNPKKTMSEEERQRVAEKEKIETDIALPLKAPPRGMPKKNMSEEERKLRERWEQRIREEEKRMREEREQQIFKPKLTEEQKRLRDIIGHRAHNRLIKKAITTDETSKLPRRGTPKTEMSAEDQCLREKWEQRIQEEEERMREERKERMREGGDQRIPRVQLTEEQRRVRKEIYSRHSSQNVQLKRAAKRQKVREYKRTLENEK